MRAANNNRLAGDTQQIFGVDRALVLDAQRILLHAPFGGIAPIEELMAAPTWMTREESLAAVLQERNAGKVVEVAGRPAVLPRGIADHGGDNAAFKADDEALERDPVSLNRSCSVSLCLVA